MVTKVVMVTFFIAFGSAHAQSMGTEISAVSGFYQSSKVKIDGSNAGGKSTISFAGRYHEFLNEDQQWFAQGGLGLRTWDAPSGLQAPSNATSIQLLGGVRQFFTEFSQLVIPYGSLYGGYLSEKDGSVGSAASETEASGLYYFGAVGFRFDVAAEAFMEIECTVFRSALFGTTVVKDSTGKKTETSTTDLYVSGLNDNLTGNLSLAIGMKI